VVFHIASVVPIVRGDGPHDAATSRAGSFQDRKEHIVVSTKQSANLQDAFDSGDTYDDYAAKIRAEGGRPANLLEKSEATVSDANLDVAPFTNVNKPLKVLVLSETWCPDCTDNLPILNEIAKRTGKFDVRIIGRDAFPEVADAHLKEGKFRSIPTMIFFDQDGNEVGTFIERPDTVTDLRQQRRREVYASDPDFGSPDTPASELPDEVRATLEPRLAEARASTRDFAIQEVTRELGEIVARA
jgi:thiol-disulfide isomerase/thioredoxin